MMPLKINATETADGFESLSARLNVDSENKFTKVVMRFNRLLEKGIKYISQPVFILKAKKRRTITKQCTIFGFGITRLKSMKCR